MNGKDFADVAADRMNTESRKNGLRSPSWKADDYGKYTSLTAYADLLAEHAETKATLATRDAELAAVMGDMKEIARLCTENVAWDRPLVARVASKYAVKPDPLVEVLGLILSRRGLPPIKDVVKDEAAFVRSELAKRGINIPSVQGGE